MILGSDGKPIKFQEKEEKPIFVDTHVGPPLKPSQEFIDHEQPEIVTLSQLQKARKKLNQKYPANSDDVPIHVKIGDMTFYLANVFISEKKSRREWIFEGRVSME